MSINYPDVSVVARSISSIRVRIEPERQVGLTGSLNILDYRQPLRQLPDQYALVL